jgi:hypothetical protein
MSESLLQRVRAAVDSTPVRDIHTHLHDPAQGGLLLRGIDEQLVYHYLVSEAFRQMDVPHERFWSASREERAAWVWDALFVRHSPVSEACRGVVTSLNLLGIDPRRHDLPALRRWFAEWRAGDFVDRVLSLANVASVCMTNSPFDDEERPSWEAGFVRDSRFVSALRIDPLLLAWPETCAWLRARGHEVSPDFSGRTLDEVRRFLADWTRRIGARYCMVSLPPSFAWPGGSDAARLIADAVLPHCREHGQAFALMMGVKRAVNPRLHMAGDGVGRSDLAALGNLCAAHPDNRFLVTCLARENQHELVVLARKFHNLHPFGCWWFTNTPSLVAEITAMRLELLGTAFTAQHSDARVLDQLLYKWRHSRDVLARVLADRYADLEASRWPVTDEEMRRDAAELLGGSFERFIAA